MAPQVVLITGSSQGGIGYALCQEFASRGCTVYATARKLASVSSLPSHVNKLELDVDSDESCDAAVAQILEKEGRIDILINNAGRGGAGALMDVTVESAKATFDTNFFSVIRLSQKVVKASMAKRKSGLIINIGSIVGNVPTPWAGIYAASKAALHSWTDVLRMEVKGLGINVLLIAPGSITSNFGTKQTESISIPDDSLYKSVSQYIYARATASQDPSSTVPASVLAKGIVDRALRSTPATYFSAGGNALFFAFLMWLPRWLVWSLVGKRLGADKVGRPAPKK